MTNPALAAVKNDPDTPNLVKALSGNNEPHFREAMSNEIKDLKAQKTGALIHKKHPPKNTKVIPITWAMKIKMFTSRAFRSFKARFCFRGDLRKKAIEEIDIYAPVVQWSTVCLVLVVSLVLKLQTRSAGFSNAFAQADMKGDPVYIHLSPKMRGFPDDHVLKLNKSFYGQADAPKMWNDKLKSGLEKRGLIGADLCLFIFKKVIFICYVDDCLWFAKNSKDIDDVHQSLRDDRYK
eukprot:15365263-Ditylum_brightwellii.AAC.1